MSFLAIMVSEAGVLRVDVFVADTEEYPKATGFHHNIMPEIDRLDQAIKEKYGHSKTKEKH